MTVEPELVVKVGHELGVLHWRMDVERAEATERLEVDNSGDARIAEAVIDAAVVGFSRDMAPSSTPVATPPEKAMLRCVRSWAPVAMRHIATMPSL